MKFLRELLSNSDLQAYSTQNRSTIGDVDLWFVDFLIVDRAEDLI